MEANKDLISVVKTYEDIEKNWKEGRMSAMLTLEEGGVCLGNLTFCGILSSGSTYDDSDLEFCQ